MTQLVGTLVNFIIIGSTLNQALKMIALERGAGMFQVHLREIGSHRKTRADHSLVTSSSPSGLFSVLMIGTAATTPACALLA
jgi:hypothetical protein